LKSAFEKLEKEIRINPRQKKEWLLCVGGIFPRRREEEWFIPRRREALPAGGKVLEPLKNPGEDEEANLF